MPGCPRAVGSRAWNKPSVKASWGRLDSSWKRPCECQMCPTTKWAVLTLDRRTVWQGCCGGTPVHVMLLLALSPSITTLSRPPLPDRTLPASLTSFPAALPLATTWLDHTGVLAFFKCSRQVPLLTMSPGLEHPSPPFIPVSSERSPTVPSEISLHSLP